MALKEGRIDVGFGRIRFDDPAITRTILRHEKLVAAFPADHPLARGTGPVSLRDLTQEPLIVYPRSPRPSYAKQVISLFRDHAIAPRIVHEARELQIAIVPESVRRARSHDVSYRELLEPATSLSHRAGDNSPELRLMAAVIARKYRDWDYEVPGPLLEFGKG